MKKPSEWTPQEAFKKGVDAARCRLIEYVVHTAPSRSGRPIAVSEVGNIFNGISFPADPVERVSDAVLRAIANDNDGTNRYLMALELIERRKGDKKEQGK